MQIHDQTNWRDLLIGGRRASHEVKSNVNVTFIHSFSLTWTFIVPQPAQPVPGEATALTTTFESRARHKCICWIWKRSWLYRGERTQQATILCWRLCERNSKSGTDVLELVRPRPHQSTWGIVANSNLVLTAAHTEPIDEYNWWIRASSPQWLTVRTY